jgi:quinol monooxygenase YgiN
MYIAIRRLKLQPGLVDEAIRRIEDGFVPLISAMPGFVDYIVMRAGEDGGVTISVFEMQEQAEESNRRAAEWISQNLAPLAAGPHEIVVVGDIQFRKGK